MLAEALRFDPHIVEVVPALLLGIALNGLAFFLLVVAIHRVRRPAGQAQHKDQVCHDTLARDLRRFATGSCSRVEGVDR